MGVPEPPISLDDSCSVIYDNTLYSYSPNGFLSLSLERGAKWVTLSPGVKVTGATCVGTTPADASQAALFIVGGTADAASYTGLQKFTYAAANWTTITPTVLVTKDRLGHGSIYIPADDAIVVYAGNQNGQSTASSSTFSIGASPPYAAEAHHSVAPAAVSPILLPWSNADAVMVGGGSTNKAVYLFNTIAGWRNYGATLAEPMTHGVSEEQAILMQGDDGSKSLVTFDMMQSPNKVSRFVLQNAQGQPVQNSPAVSSRDLSQAGGGSTSTSLTLANWPKYNSTLAPTITRKNFAMAQGSNGMVVFSGGHSGDPLCMFNADENKWMNTSEFFAPHEEQILQLHSSATSASTSSATSVSSSTAALSSSVSQASHTTASTTTSDAAVVATTPSDSNGVSNYSSNTILGITLGSIFGFMALLGLILFILRRRKRAQNPFDDAVQPRRGAGGIDALEKEPNGLARSAAAPVSPIHFRGHQPQPSQESYSSMAILMGRVNQQKQGLSRQRSHDSLASSVSSFHKDFKSTISKPIPQASEHPALQQQGKDVFSEARTEASDTSSREEQDGMRRSSGWNRYWSGGSALQILGFGGAKRATGVSDQSSHYSQGAGNQNSRATQDSATVPPLNFGGAKPEVVHVNSGSPVVSQTAGNVAYKQGLSGKIERSPSNASSGYSSGIPESVMDDWDPLEDKKPWGSERAPSSAYSSSLYHGAPLASSHGAGREQPPSGVSKQPQLAMACTSDMSWLNLGDQSRV